MTYNDLYLYFLKKYNEKDDKNKNTDFFNLVFSFSKDIKNIADFYTKKNTKISLKIDTKSFLNKMEIIFQKGIPISLLVRNKYFYGYKFYIRKGALTPRSETELLVDKIIFENYKTNLKILDLCAGIGNIGFTLAKNLNARVTLVEKYNLPYSIMLKNKRILKLNKNIKLIKKDIKNFLITNRQKFDIIVMNPPYIKYNDRKIENSVLKFEPKSALFAKNKGLYFYELLLFFVPYIMKHKIIIYMEIGFNQKEM